MTNSVQVRGLAGLEETMIVGSGPVGSNAIRVVYLGVGSSLEGFTIRQGSTLSTKDWERKHFKNLDQGPCGDPDGDGRTNEEELEDGTDPMDPSSTLGLVAHYKLDGNALDSTSNRYDGTVSGALATTNRLNQDSTAMLFDGADDSLVVGEPPAMTDQMTVSAWFKINKFNARNPIVSKSEGTEVSPGDGSDVEYVLVCKDGCLEFEVVSDDGGTGRFVEPRLPFSASNEWTHVAGVIDVTNDCVCLYINGSLADSQSLNGRHARALKQKVRIGSVDWWDGYYGRESLDGAVDDVRIYTRSLDSNEVARLAGKAVCEDGKYTVTVTFDAEGGTPPTPPTKTITHNGPYGSLATTAREGYTFVGWWTVSGGTGTRVTENKAVTATADHTLYARWEPKTEGLYMVIDLSGETNSMGSPVSYLDGVPASGWTDEYKTTKLVMRKISAGTFVMGSPEGELGRDNEYGRETQHRVTLTEDFYIGVFEVTQRQWELVMGNNPCYFGNGNCYTTRPVERVSYNDIRDPELGANWPASRAVDPVSFVGVLRAKTGVALDLPTEAQWEYACRAGTETALNSGKNLTDTVSCPNMSEVGRYAQNGGIGQTWDCDTSVGTASVGSYSPNLWNLYDMHGNVWEYCLDWMGPYSDDTSDPQGALWGLARVERGGSWYYDAHDCRSAKRASMFSSEVPVNNIGFRIASAILEPETNFNLTVVGGTGSGRYSVGSEVTATADAPPVGQEFAHWMVSPEGAVLGSCFSLTHASTRITMPPYDVTLTATFSANRFTVHFDAQGGTSPTPPTKTVIYNAPYGLLATTAREGYSFNGWWTGVGGTGSQVTEATVVTAITDHTLYAGWVQDDLGEWFATVGVAFSEPLPEEFAGMSRVTVKGLPGGLVYSSATMSVKGVPTRLGVFDVVISAPGVEPQTLILTVAALPDWASGVYSGRVSVWRDQAHEPGLVTMTVTPTGKVAGKYSHGGTNYTFAASSYARREANGSLWMETQAKSGKLSIPLAIEMYPAVALAGNTGVPASLGIAEGWLGNDREHEPPLLMLRDVWKDAGEALAPCVGYYTATLPGNAEYGSGFLTLTVDKTGKMKVGGKLADGKAVSLSGSLLLDDVGRVFAVFYTAPTAYKGGCLYGLAEFANPGDGGKVVLHPLNGEPFMWLSRNPQATSIFQGGFERQPSLDGGWYGKVGDLGAFYEGKTLVVGTDSEAPRPELNVGTARYDSAWWDPTGLVLPPTGKPGAMVGLSAAAAGKPADPDNDGKWDYSMTNSVGLKISLTRPTGLFKGSFQAWFDYPEKKHVAKSLAFEGVLTPVREDLDDGVEGRGFFLWQDKAEPPLPAKPYAFSWSYDFKILLAE